jgi:protein involved in polysaccharide export with SLBB domain
MFQRIFGLVAIILLCLAVVPAHAQTPDQEDFSSVKVDELSDAQIRDIIKQAEASGLGDVQLEQMVLAKGMPTTEVVKLRARVEQIKKQAVSSSKKQDGTRTVNGQREGNAEVSDEPDSLAIKRSRIFGAELFANNNPTFEPNLRIATPVDYQIGPDDEILVDIYGYSEANYTLRVSPDGTINIPLVGLVSVSGATMEQASSRIKARLSTVYPGIKNGNTKVGITLGNIRSIKVVLTGEIVKPGTYTLPSVANMFNALYASGGPNENGSFRQVQIIRGGEIIAILDVYDFLLYGALKNNIRLQDQDVIRIPPYKTRVEINGEVKRPAIFEMKFNETLGDLIRFAGDFTESAYKARMKVVKNTDTEHEIQDITAQQFETYIPATGDKYFVEKILERYKNRVTVNGAVFRPGEFELNDGLTLKQLIIKADGLKEDAFGNRGYITRLKDDLTREILSFSTADILSERIPDIVLKREDIINIPSIFDLKDEYTVTVAGEVRSPGTMKFGDGMSLEDAIIMSGGLKESATSKRIEIARRIKTANPMSDTSGMAQLFTVNIDRSLKEASNFILKPFDIISVYPAPGYEIQRTVVVEGEVLFPGTYTISNKNERISDVIKRAGGLTASAYKDGASLKRQRADKTQLEREQEELKLQKFEDLQKKSTDTSAGKATDIRSDVARNNFVGIDLSRIMSHPRKSYDLLLENGDVISVPKQLQTVKVSGEVLSPSAVVYRSSYGFKKYILGSGGFSGRAFKKRAYITYANGSVEGTKSFLFFRNYPKVKPGAEIFVPLKPENRSKISVTEVVAITTAIATLGTLIYSVTK